VSYRLWRVHAGRVRVGLSILSLATHEDISVTGVHSLVMVQVVMLQVPSCL
jgi:hypothetical protein